MLRKQQFLSDAVAYYGASAPDSLAFVEPGGFLTFRTLDDVVTGVAALLAARGIGPEVAVAVHASRLQVQLISILAILRCGAAYVPLDPDQPVERSGAICRDADVALILTDTASREGCATVAPGVDSVVVTVDSDSIGPTPSSRTAFRARDADSLACVYYTSGTTGVPRGVEVTIGSLSNYLDWVAHELCEASGGRFAPWTTPITFDAVFKQALAPLVVGRPVTAISRELPVPDNALLEWLKRNPGAALNAVPWRIDGWLRAIEERMADGEAAPSVAALLIGGDVLRSDLVARARCLWPNARILNLYGPTEATANAAMAVAPATDPCPIGRAVAGARLTVSSASPPVPRGQESGELLIGGPGVARGYRRQPAETALRFRPDPEGPAGARRYHSGDLVQLRPDGQIAFLGRVDRQVKLRGVRIEPGEIEAQLLRFPGVDGAVVVPDRSRSLPDGHLSAFISTSDGTTPSLRALRRHLVRTIPRPALPSHYYLLSTVPRQNSGKVDFAALWLGAVPLSEDPNPESVIHTGAQAATVRITIAEVLDLSELTDQDNFLDAGGDSISCMRIINRLRTLLNVDLTYSELLDSPTVGDFIQHIHDLTRQIEPGDDEVLEVG